MTTNVFDRVVGTLATDSRWSQRQGRWLVYVDDTNFHKFELTASTVFMFAGKGSRIQEWKNWIKNGADQNTLPEFDGICICAVDIPSHAIKICEGLPIVQDGAAFGGSGALYAFSCWAVNGDAKRSVETAKTLDPATGGMTRYFDLKTQQHNLTENIFGETSIADVDRAILERGIVMDIANSKSGAPYKLSDLAASNDEVRELQNKIASGTLSADAPADAMYNQWTPEQKNRVKSALGEIFRWNT